MRPFRRLFALPFRSRATIERDVDDELEFHLSMRAAELQARHGWSPETARQAARAEFGDLETTRRLLNRTDRGTERRQRMGTMLSEAWQDARHALRQMARAPLLAMLAILTLALGIGAATSVYSMVHAVLLAPLPYAASDRIVALHQFDRSIGARVELAPLNFADWRERARTLQHVAMAEPYSLALTGAGDPVKFDTWRVTEGFFAALGGGLLHGRPFTAAEHEAGAAGTVILSHRVFRGRFAGDPAIVGRSVVLDGQAHTVVGVLRPDFTFPTEAGFYVPRPVPTVSADGANRVSTYLSGVARLSPGVALEQARREAEVIGAELAQVDPAANRQMGLTVTPLHEHLTGRVAGPLLVLLAAVLAVQLIACANVGSLLLARGVERRREFAVRAALGAGRGRLARQLLVEAAVLAAVALALGLAAGAAGVRLLRRLAPADLPRLDTVSLGPEVALFALALTAATVLIAGLAPALQQGRTDAGATLRDGTSGSGRRRLPRAFVGAEVALTLMLLVGAGLLLRSHARLLQEDLGFQPDNTLAMTIHVWGEFPDPARRAAFFGELETRLAALPGVRSVGAANSLPLSIQGSEMDPPFQVEGAPAVEPGLEPTAVLTIVTPGFFDALGLQLRRGRAFDRRDDAAAPPVVLINETLARRFFPGADPVGKRLTVLTRTARVSQEIVGVVNDVRHARLDEVPRPEIYLPLAQRSFGSMTLLLRSAGPVPASLPAQAQAALWSLRPGLIFDNVEHLDQRLADTLAPRRFVLALVGGFALVALGLALIGIYGAVSFAVSRRTNEIGVRMALGASATGIVGMLIREELAVVLAGGLVGLAAAAALTRAMSALLFGVSPFDPATFSIIALLMLGTAAVAAWLPARRAARVDPVKAIRSDG